MNCVARGTVGSQPFRKIRSLSCMVGAWRSRGGCISIAIGKVAKALVVYAL